MTRTALALAALLTLFLNGSIAVAAIPACSGGGACTLPLGMMTPPPPRPVDLVHDTAAPATVRR